MSQPFLNSTVFNHPFACLISGPSKSGKSVLVQNILINNNDIINKKIDRIIYCYSAWQAAFENENFKRIVPAVEFHSGVPDLDNIDPSRNNIIILDDLMNESCTDNAVQDLFCIHSHHKSISVFLMTQNLFPKSKNSRTISLNCDYIIVMNNPRDRAQIGFLSRQVFPKNYKYLIEAYDDATDMKQFGYLLIDLSQTTKSSHRLQTCILPSENRIFYLPLNYNSAGF